MCDFYADPRSLITAIHSDNTTIHCNGAKYAWSLVGGGGGGGGSV